MKYITFFNNNVQYQIITYNCLKIHEKKKNNDTVEFLNKVYIEILCPIICL